MLNILRLAIGRVYRRRQCSVFQLSNSSRSRNTATTIANRLFGIDRQHQAHSKPRPQPSYSDEMGDTVNENGASSSTTPTAAAAATSNLPGLVKFLELVGNLKHLKRTGWVLRDVNDCETIAGHMYRMSLMTFLLDGQNGLDRTKCMELALVHDLAESIVGDITPYCGVSKEDKKQREMDAMREITQLIAPRGEHLMELFEEYEEGQSPESKFVKDLDRLDLVLQAFEYEKRDNCPSAHQEFFDSNEGKFNHPMVVDLVNEIKAQRAVTIAASAAGTPAATATDSASTNGSGPPPSS